jgi:hypothetical protein
LVNSFKGLKNMGYSYEMASKFPNGDNDKIKGATYINNDDWIYYNDCDAFLMLYTRRYFYKADHRKRIVTFLDMDKGYNKKQRSATEKAIFQNGAVITFLDSIVLKTATVKKLTREGNVVEASLEFPKKALVKKFNITFDYTSNLPVNYEMTVYHPFQNTPKGVQVIESTIRCNDFKKEGKNQFSENEIFSYKKGKLELKKYTNYRLSTKM